MTRDTAVVFGAGNVGRGLLGQVFSEAGLEVVFADVDDALIATLARDRRYRHITVDNDTRVERVIEPVTAIPARDAAAVREVVAEARVAATCVGVRAMPAVCGVIAPALLARSEAGGEPLNLLIAENLHDGPAKVAHWLIEAEPALAEHLEAGRVGLIATSIGRMIPAPRPGLDVGGAAIEVEPYCHLPIDVHALRGDFPAIPAVVADDRIAFGFYADRKLFIHNMGHAMCAYLGRLCGDREIAQAIGRAEVRALVRGAMIESACAIAEHHGQPVGPLLDHVDDLIHRFGNRALGDTVERVGTDPRRKLASGDRLVGAYRLCLSHGIDPRRLRVGLAAGLDQLADEESLDDEAMEAFLLVQGFADPAEHAGLAEHRAVLREGLDGVEALLDRRFRETRIP
jgi:mannitol-1-phosphate 5-dehydrogenase